MSTSRLSASAAPSLPPSADLHVARRFSFGVHEKLCADLRSAGSGRAWLEKQLYPSTFSDPAADAVLSWYPRLRDSPATVWRNGATGTYGAWQYGQDLAAYTMARRVLSRRQVSEVMADFWGNLLYIPTGEDRSFPHRFSYDQMIRANALGSFRTLLKRAVVHPAMSGWLNNSSNTKRGINENLGRELLELYTVGRPSGYTETDVKNSARLLTGYHVAVFDDFAATYRTADHYVGTVKVLGFTHANRSSDGRAAVGAYLDYLARHPATAKRIARRLCVRFVSDAPSQGIVDAVAKAYRASDTSIKATLRALVKHPEFQASKDAKVRTPVEDVVNVVRVLGHQPTGSGESSLLQQMIWMGEAMGQVPFGWPRPDGFPEASSTWTSPARVLRTWDIHWSLAALWWQPTKIVSTSKVGALPTEWPLTLAQLVEHQSRLLLGRGSTADMRSAVATTLGWDVSRSVASAEALPDWAWVVIRSTVLNSPEGMLR